MAEKKTKTTTKKDTKDSTTKKVEKKSDKPVNLAAVAEKKREYFKLKMDVFAGKTKDVNVLKAARKEIARMLTQLNNSK